jgi:hypothetical protein
LNLLENILLQKSHSVGCLDFQVEPLLPEGEELFLLDLTEAGLLTTTLGVVVVDVEEWVASLVD